MDQALIKPRETLDQPDSSACQSRGRRPTVFTFPQVQGGRRWGRAASGVACQPPSTSINRVAAERNVPRFSLVPMKW